MLLLWKKMGSWESVDYAFVITVHFFFFEKDFSQGLINHFLHSLCTLGERKTKKHAT